MILTGNEIAKRVSEGDIVINPFDKSNLDTNSYDFQLGNEIKVYKNKMLDAKKHNPTKSIKIPKSGFVLKPDTLYLGCTKEIMGSKKYVPIIRGRSSTGRLGLFIHITAGLIDIGSINRWTLMLHAVQPVKIYPGMLIGQVSFWETIGEITLYDGKYQSSMGPVESLGYRDF